MSKGFTFPLTDVLAGEIGPRSIDAEWQALLARPDAPPLPPEPAVGAGRLVRASLDRLLMRTRAEPPLLPAALNPGQITREGG